MVGYVGKVTNWQRDLIGRQIQSAIDAQWGEIPGKVVDFNPEAQTISVQPLYRPVHNGEPVDMPVLFEVPVRFPRSGGFVMTTPIKAGDMVSLRPQMRSTDNFHKGDGFAPSDARSFHLSDYEAFLDGGEPLSDPIQNFNSQNMELRSADGQFAIEMSEDGKFRMRGAEGNWFDLLATLAEKLAADTLVIKYGSSAGSGHALQFQSDYAEIAAKLRSMAL